MGGNIKLGLKENWQQFSLLVLINGFVGAMVGLERTILPILAKDEFLIAANTAILSFIAVFGLTKAVANYYAGSLANKVGRKKLLVLGWLFAVPVPVILILAPSWGWVLVANAFLGVNQGLAWSSTVVMKIDLVGPKQRGLAMGINESVGYLAVGATAFFTSAIASVYGLRPYPFYIGIALVVLGLLMSILFVRDTSSHVELENKDSNQPIRENIFSATTFKDKNLGSITQAGLINNLIDAMVWGVLPLVLATQEFTIKEIGILVAIYPAVWGLGQIITGKIADTRSKKNMIAVGMLLQGVALLLMVFASHSFSEFALVCALLGVGTAMVYPTFLAAISDYTHPSQRAEGLGVFRLWRDLGYVVGAVLVGLLADSLGISVTITAVAALSVISCITVAVRMDE